MIDLNTIGGPELSFEISECKSSLFEIINAIERFISYIQVRQNGKALWFLYYGNLCSALRRESIMKYILAITIILSAFLCGAVFGKYHVIYNARIYAESNCILMDIDGSVHVYAD